MALVAILSMAALASSLSVAVGVLVTLLDFLGGVGTWLNGISLGILTLWLAGEVIGGN